MNDDDNNQQQLAEDDQNNTTTAKTHTKHKVAVIFGYCGYGYYGLQNNSDPAHPTIEAALIEGLHKAGYISDENMMGMSLKKLNWERASRTDKGVSALRNIVSCRLILPNGKTEQEWLEPLNELLKPKKLQVFRIIITTASFDCYLSCTGRVYEYLLPTYALLSPDEAGDLRQMIIDATPAQDLESHNANQAARAKSVCEDETAAAAAVAAEKQQAQEDQEATNNNNNRRRRPRDDLAVDVANLPAELYDRLRSFRISQDKLHRLRGYFAVMEGTNSFHNFTPSASAGDPSCNRFIRNIKVSEPFVIDGKIEWVRILLDGQSFMLNQIRKMVGCAVEATTRNADAGFVRSMFLLSLRRMMPMAPANGLFLSTLKVDKYNHKLERIQSEGRNAEGKAMIVIDEVPADDPMRILVERSVCEHEFAEQITARWVAGLLHTRAEDFVLPAYEPGAARSGGNNKAGAALDE